MTAVTDAIEVLYECGMHAIDALGDDLALEWLEQIICVYLCNGPHHQQVRDVMHVIGQMLIAAALRAEVKARRPVL